MIPPQQSAEFVAQMEVVLETYSQPYDPTVPVVNMDEQPVQLVRETRTPIAAEPGHPERVDYEYERAGMANVFMFTEALASWRDISVWERKTSVDWARAVRHVLETRYATARKVILVCDNLNTHRIASFYEAFPPEEAFRLAARVEIRHTPKHGSWLNIAECELSAFTRQALVNRVPDVATLREKSKSWVERRNAEERRVVWHFTTEDARIKLKRLYPEFQLN